MNNGQASARPWHIRAGRVPGQASVELPIILGISLIVVLMIAILSSDTISDTARQQSISEARDSVRSLAEAADSVYSQGEGASRTVTVRLPPTTVFGANSTYIGKPAGAPSSALARLVNINAENSDIQAISSVPLTGAFPSSAGIYRMKVVSRGDYVSIKPALIELDRNSISISMANDETRLVVLKAYRLSIEPASASVAADWGFSGISLSVSPSSFALSDSGTIITINATATAASAGIYRSQLVVNATGTQSGITEAITIPISVSVQAG